MLAAQLEPTPIDAIPGVVAGLRTAFDDGVVRSIDDRRAVLEQIKAFLIAEEDAIVAALHADLGKAAVEAYATEIGFTLAEIDHVLSHLHRWSRPEKVRVQLTMRPGRARIVAEPLGVVLVIAPWNYPLQLVLAPLVAAIAAGNTVVVKPSEVAAATARLLARDLGRYVDGRAVAVVSGAVEETTALLAQRFDHIFYTGNGSVGRIVMRAAAEHLTPVTLELGGKSPAIVTADADVEVAARRIAWGKFVNAGQTCVAPDHVLVDESVEERFVDALVAAVHRFYGDDPRQSPDYARIVDERHHDRLTGLLAAGGYSELVLGGDGDRAARFLAPTIVRGVEPTAALMQEEIFGPILPLLSVGGLDEAISFVASRPKPLALYVFSEDERSVDRVIAETSAGGVTVNHTLLHLAVTDLPFGGVGDSGFGAYHGKAGFDRFSHRKSVLVKPRRPDPPVLYPPYGRWKARLVRRAL